MKNNSNRKVVLLDDDYLIREVLKKILSKYTIYTTDNGIEGLGYIYLSKPDLIIIDTTLPKYDGLEVISYLLSNKSLIEQNTPIIALHEEKNFPTDYPNITFVSKNEKDFLEKLQNAINSKLQENKVLSSSFKKDIGNLLIKISNKSDRIQRKIESKEIKTSENDKNIKVKKRELRLNRLPASTFFLWVYWLLIQLVISFFLAIFVILVGRNSKDENLPQEREDRKRFRVRYYPTMATAIVALMFLLLQVGLYISGGIIIFNTKITSIFASEQYQTNVEVDFSEATFNNNEIQYLKGRFELKKEQITPSLEPLLEQEESPVPTEPSSFPVVLGASTVQSSYFTSNPSITFTKGIEYKNLKSILEVSDINTKASSLDNLENRPVGNSYITYQISPDSLNWYYYGSEGWEITQLGFVSSNRIQVINKNIAAYVAKVQADKLYIKAYLHSDGSTQIGINGLSIERPFDSAQGDKILEVNPTEMVQPTTDVIVSYPNSEVIIPASYPVSVSSKYNTILTPTLFQASYYEGNKIVYGKIIKSNIDPVDLDKFVVRIYYTSSTDFSSPALDKTELIGETGLVVSGEDLTFLLSTPNREGGYVTAELVYKEGDNEFMSNLAKPMENSTFTVDYSGDEDDSGTGDGICLTAGGKCTLRAAITQANSSVGSDNIYFNIPTSDSGYRDYDTPNTSSSGDSAGGDDYWTIRPATAFPTISGTTIIDGATQEVNQGDKNSNGPDIEIRGTNTITGGITFSGASSSINKVSISQFLSYQLTASASLTVTNSHINIDVKGNLSLHSTTGGPLGIFVNASDVHIGNTISDGNVIAAGNSYSINITCGAWSGIQIRGNIIGVSKDFTTSAGTGTNQISIQGSGACAVEVGGSSPSFRNWITGSVSPATAHIIITASNATVGIYNNFFGTNQDGTAKAPNGTYNLTTAIYATTNPSTSNISIGDNGSGNLFRFIPFGVRILANTNIGIKGNTFSDLGISGSGIRIGTSSGSILTFSGISILNNFIGVSTSDPNFGLNVGNSVPGYVGIENWGGNPTIKGNKIVGMSNFGISSYPNYNSVRTNSANYPANKPTIGGQNALTGSLCNSNEQNCISTNAWGGIYSRDGLPSNELTLWSDNDFTGGNGLGGAVNIEQAWLGLFELDSSNYRRTDLTGTIINFPSGTKVRTTDDPSTVVTSATAISVTCLGSTGVSCPSTGHTVGTLDNSYMFVPSGQTATVLSNVNNWFRATQYIYDGTGHKTDYSAFKFDQAHFASTLFTFDGDSTNNIINTGSSRTIDTQTYTDRGEPWTDKPTATRNIATGDLGRFQIMEVEYVDANPVLQGDSSYIITVDSTEDIALATGTAYFDDGTGSVSGGMSKLATATLSNGKTSLREAITVANNRVGYDNIYFNIATSDSNYVAPASGVQGYWPIVTSSSIGVADDSGVFINGYSQPGSSRNTTVFGETIDAVLNIQIRSTVITALAITGNNNHLAGLNIGAPSSTAVGLNFSSSSYNWLEGNFFGSTINGTAGLNEGSIVMALDSTNNIVGTNGDGVGDSGERNLFATNGTNNNGNIDMQAANGGSHIIAGNYFGTDKTGRACSSGNKNRARLGMGGPNIRIGSNLDGISDLEESNIIACVNNDPRGLIRIVGPAVTNLVVQGNYLGISPKGDMLSSISGESGIVFNTTVANSIFKNNTIAGSPSWGIVNQTAGEASNKGNSFIQNKIYGSTNLNIALNVNSTPTVNDSEDSDAGPNNLMNYPVIQKVTYIGGERYKLEGILDNNVSIEAPFSIEVCQSDNHTSGNGGCLQSLGTVGNITQISGGINTWSLIVTIAGDNGTQNRSFTSLATNALGSTSEFSQNFTTLNNPNYVMQDYPIIITNPGDITDNVNPLFDWNSSSDPDIESYDVYLDNVKISTVTSSISEYKYTENTLAGTHNLRIEGKRQNGTISGLGEKDFLVKPGTTLELSNFDNVTTDNTKPTLDWNIEKDTLANTVEIYINNVFYKSLQANITEYTFENELEYGDYTWQVIAYYKGVDGDGKEIYQEIGRSSTGKFTIKKTIPKVIQNINGMEKPVSFNSDPSIISVETVYSLQLLILFCGILLCGSVPFAILILSRRHR